MVADLFHYGHVEFLKKSRAYGNTLIVGICSDELVQRHKRMPIMSMDERIRSVSNCQYVDEVIPNAPWTIDKNWINKHKIDVVIHSDDYSPEQIANIYKVPIAMGIFHTVSYTPAISTTEIIRRCQRAKTELL
jgi:cytidyltransferase-like protein